MITTIVIQKQQKYGINKSEKLKEIFTAVLFREF